MDFGRAARRFPCHGKLSNDSVTRLWDNSQPLVENKQRQEIQPASTPIQKDSLLY